MRIVMLFFVSLMSYQCFGGQLYSNMDLDFSFELPDGWSYTQVEELSEESQKRLNRQYSSQTILIAQKDNGDPFSFPCIQVNYKALSRTSDSEAKREVFSDEGIRKLTESAVRLAEILMRFKTDDFTLIESGSKINSEKKALYAFNKYQHKDGRELIAVVAKLLGPRKIVTLRCYEKGDGIPSFLSTLNELIASFDFGSNESIGNNTVSEKPEIKEHDDNSDDANEINNDSNGKTYLWLPLGFFATVLIFILCRRASSR